MFLFCPKKVISDLNFENLFGILNHLEIDWVQICSGKHKFQFWPKFAQNGTFLFEFQISFSRFEISTLTK